VSSSSVNGIDHALKLNFMSTLGPGIPVTPTVSVFGDGLPGFINRNPSHPGGIFGYSPEEEKKLVRKIDWRIIPILGLLYGASTLSKTHGFFGLFYCNSWCILFHEVRIDTHNFFLRS